MPGLRTAYTLRPMWQAPIPAECTHAETLGIWLWDFHGSSETAALTSSALLSACSLQTLLKEDPKDHERRVASWCPRMGFQAGYSPPAPLCTLRAGRPPQNVRQAQRYPRARPPRAGRQRALCSCCCKGSDLLYFESDFFLSQKSDSLHPAT